MGSLSTSRRVTPRRVLVGLLVLALASCVGLRVWTHRAPPAPHAAPLSAVATAVPEVPADAALLAHLAAPSGEGGAAGWTGPGEGCVACHAARPGQAHGAWPADSRHEAVGFCAACHQGGPVVQGKPLRDTVEEWRRTPAAAAGRSCVACHPGGQAGAAEAAAVRAAFTPSVKVAVSESGWGVGKLKITATDAVGHRLPTGAGVRLRLSMVQVDRAGLAIEDTAAREELGRELVAGEERADSRLLPGESHTLGYTRPLHEDCTAVIARVESLPPGLPPLVVWEERVLLLPE